jgi:ABC-type dipeptide/oligopeptide/nickel transport system ATPase component
MLERVQIPKAAERIGLYPFEFSGGMRQRAMIAMALLCQPELLIADEPTTALDVTVQAQILELLAELRSAGKTSFAVITHDLGVIAGLCDYVLVMYAGRIVESGPVRDIFKNPAASLYRGAAGLDAAAGCDRHDAACHHRRPAAEPAAPAARLRLQRSLRLRDGTLPGRAPGLARIRTGKEEGMPSGPDCRL